MKPKTKVVVRALPPCMSEETFLEVLNNIAKDRYTWFSYFPGKIK